MRSGPIWMGAPNALAIRSLMFDACFFIFSPYLPGLRPMPIAAQCQIDVVSQLLLYE